MSAVLFMYSLSLFLIGLVSEQISALHYKGVEEDQRRTRRDEPHRWATPLLHRTDTGQDPSTDSHSAGISPVLREKAEDRG